jgi:predicted TIM-barrel fold metal-dependent hydrolase
VNKDDMILISVDDHTVEPPDMFKNHLPKKYVDDAPRLVHNDDGSDCWQFRDTIIPNVALNAVAGRPKEEYGLEPQGLDEIRPGCYNVDERVKDMNAGGILAFIPMAIPVIWDAEECAKEVRRVAKKGVHALTFTENPAAMGYPSFHNEHWKPLWEALVDTDTVMNVHIGSSGRLAITAPDAPMDVMITLQPMNIVQAAADLLWSQPIKDYPDLKIGLSEGGTGWIPYFLERADRTYEMHSTWTKQNFGGKIPSEVFREHFLTCFISDKVGVKLRNMIGIDNICWEADYPHSDSMWPGAPEELWDVLSENNVPDDEIKKMTYQNAMRWYSFDPFSHITPAQATVGSLRKAAEGHDVSTRALSQHKESRSGSSLAEFTASAKELTGNKD